MALNPQLQAYRDCYAACRAAGGDVATCQQRCDPAFTGLVPLDPLTRRPITQRLEGDCTTFWDCFGAGVKGTLQTATGAVVQYLPGFGEISGLVKWVVVGAGILLAYRVLRS